MTIGQISDLETAKNVKIVNQNSAPALTAFAGVEVDTAHVSAPAANTAAQVTFAAVAGSRHQFEYIAWSYDDTPTDGNLTIHNGAGATYFNIDIIRCSFCVLFFILFEIKKKSNNTWKCNS